MQSLAKKNVDRKTGGATIDHTWVITSGIVSLLCVTGDGDSVEEAMAGYDSVIGFPGMVRKNEAAFRAQAQVAGAALRVSARVLQAAIKRGSQIYLPLLDDSSQSFITSICQRAPGAPFRLIVVAIWRAAGHQPDISGSQ